jgi:hypothetical protein
MKPEVRPISSSTAEPCRRERGSPTPSARCLRAGRL